MLPYRPIINPYMDFVENIMINIGHRNVLFKKKKYKSTYCTHISPIYCCV
uniref:Uncharacterized protein n=1 Tax=Anguilla anguilla TaxID=7936 RepID=A0A0E9U6Y4_ANGAN